MSISAVIPQPDISAFYKQSSIQRSCQPETKFCIQFKFKIACFIRKKSIGGIDIFIGAGSYRMTSESPQTVVSSNKKLFDKWKLNRVSIRNSYTNDCTVCPCRIQTEFSIITTVQFKFDVLRKRYIADQHFFSRFHVGPGKQPC